MNEGQNTADQTQYLTFHIAGEEYAVGILRVKEIITYGTITTAVEAMSQRKTHAQIEHAITSFAQYGFPESGQPFQSVVLTGRVR